MTSLHKKKVVRNSDTTPNLTVLLAKSDPGCIVKSFNSEHIFKKIRGHQSFFMGPLIPCLGLLVTPALSFKARVDPLTCVLYDLLAIEFSDSPLMRHLLTSW